VLAVVLAAMLGIVQTLKPGQMAAPSQANTGTELPQVVPPDATTPVPAPAPQIKPAPPGDVVNGNKTVIEIHDQKGTVIINPAASAPTEPKPSVSRPVPDRLLIEFDREDSIYHHGDKQRITIRIPSAGYLYVASVWAAENGSYLYYHPGWSAGLVPLDSAAGSGGPRTYLFDAQRYGRSRAERAPVSPQRFEPGDTLILPDNGLTFPELEDKAAATTFEHLIAFMSDQPLPSIPDYYGKGPNGEGNVEPAIIRLGLLSEGQVMRTRGGLPPALIQLSDQPRLVHASAVYEIRRKPR
jgi:hypothetical protein